MSDETVMRFQVVNTEKKFHLLADAAQEAECMHERHGCIHNVVALVSEPGFFHQGEVVYTSKGAPD